MNREIEINNNLTGRNEFIEGIKKSFPESLAEMYDLEDELLHMDMANFARTTEKAILENNTELIEAHFNFIGELFSRANPDLENAIYVSYLENVLLFQEDSKYIEARKLLPSNLAKALKELEKHFEKLRDASKDT
jgi:hypothetical protein